MNVVVPVQVTELPPLGSSTQFARAADAAMATLRASSETPNGTQSRSKLRSGMSLRRQIKSRTWRGFNEFFTVLWIATDWVKAIFICQYNIGLCLP